MKKSEIIELNPLLPVTLGYDTEGRVNSAVDAAGTHALAYDALDQLESESIGGVGILAGVLLDPHYTTAGWKGRLDGLQTSLGGTAINAQSFGYEPLSGRMQTVGEGAQSARYDYLAGSDLVERTTVIRGGAEALTTLRGYDSANRLSVIEASRYGRIIERHELGYNTAGQVDGDTMGDGTRWEYSYDGRLEVTAAARKQADGTALAGHGFGYAYDAIGNRQTATVNGRVSIFGENGLGANGLNQYEKRTVPGAVDVLGTAAVGALVLVNGIEVVRQAQDFAATVTVDNTAQAQHQALTVKAIKPGAGNGLDP